ncbi:MAG: hypothetical protein U1F41_06885 [Burkholderiales bacterium]
MASDWRLAPDFDPSRHRLLLDPVHTFESILGRLESATVVSARWEHGWDGALGGRVRIAFEIRADEDTVDLFHNGIDGYRARFYRSVKDGDAANANALARLSGTLPAEAIAWDLGEPAPAFPEDWRAIAEAEVARSLVAAGAKLWISEHAVRQRYGVDWAPGSLQDVHHELRVERWMRAMLAPTQPNDAANFAGTRAYRVDRISVKGGFIVPGDISVSAVVPQKKERRSHDIHERGFS